MTLVALAVCVTLCFAVCYVDGVLLAFAQAREHALHAHKVEVYAITEQVCVHIEVL